MYIIQDFVQLIMTKIPKYISKIILIHYIFILFVTFIYYSNTSWILYAARDIMSRTQSFVLCGERVKSRSLIHRCTIHGQTAICSLWFVSCKNRFISKDAIYNANTFIIHFSENIVAITISFAKLNRMSITVQMKLSEQYSKKNWL